MGILKPVLILAILSSALLCNNAWATTPPPRVGAVADPAPAASAPDARPAAQVSTPPKPAKKPIKRRSVRQDIESMPRVQAPTVYGPQLTPPAAAGVPPPSSQILNGCNGGAACLDANGAQYHGGVGTTLLSPQGRVCSNNGITVQCF